MGYDHFQEAHIRVERPEIVQRVASDIERTMRDLHDIEEGEDDDFLARVSGFVQELDSLFDGRRQT